MKRCPQCGNHKAVEAFGNDRKRPDGLACWCLECCRRRDRERYQRYREKRIENATKWKREHPERAREWTRRHRAENPEYYAEVARRRRARDPEKERARRAIQNAVSRGKVIRPNRCQRCGAEGQTQAHHADYSKPMDVEWLCGVCHGAEHERTST